MKKNERQIYVKVFEHFGNKKFCIADDTSLKRVGYSEDDIIDIKVKTIKSWMDHGDIIEIYKKLNELFDGKNEI